MESEFYNSINWALTTDPAESLGLFPYDTLAPPPAQGNDIWPDPQLELLLSASSYPIPEPPQPQGLQELDRNNPVHLYGGLFATNFDPSSEDGGNQPTDEATTLSTPNPPKQRTFKTTDAAKKRGRPRKLVEDAVVNPEEVRIMLDLNHLI
jgi:hypothetical protein